MNGRETFISGLFSWWGTPAILTLLALGILTYLAQLAL